MEQLSRAVRLDQQLRAAEVVTAIQPRDARGRLLGRRTRRPRPRPAGTLARPVIDTPPAIA